VKGWWGSGRGWKGEGAVAQALACSLRAPGRRIAETGDLPAVRHVHPWSFLGSSEAVTDGDYLPGGATMWRTDVIRDLGFTRRSRDMARVKISNSPCGRGRRDVWFSPRRRASAICTRTGGALTTSGWGTWRFTTGT